jgi:hypothetical protein
MFYLLLIIPHIAVIGGMLWFAFSSDEREPPDAGWDDGPGNDPAPVVPGPRSGPSHGPPLSEAEQPRPRLRPGESLADRTLPRPRRDEHPAQPERVPAGGR